MRKTLQGSLLRPDPSNIDGRDNHIVNLEKDVTTQIDQLEGMNRYLKGVKIPQNIMGGPNKVIAEKRLDPISEKREPKSEGEPYA